MSLLTFIKDLGRLREILTVFFDEGFHFVIENSKLHKHVPVTSKFSKKNLSENQLPKSLVKALEKLGPTFVKFGQMLSDRPDVVPIEYSTELRKLQDDVAPLEFKDVKDIVESNLKKPLNEVFSSFEKTPLGSGSIAQVHKAKLKNGKYVAVKVQRPHVKDLMSRDIDIMKYIAKEMYKHYPACRLYNPMALVDEFAQWTEKELDFRVEARYAEKFSSNFRNNKNVVFPKIYWEFTNEHVLVMEFIEGIKIRDMVLDKKYDCKKIEQIGANAMLKMILEDGFFHADPHPGNFLVMEKNRIAFLDFGIVGVFSDKDKKHFGNLIMALSSNDSEMVCYELMRIGKSDNTDADNLRRDIESFLASWEYDKNISIGHALYEALSISSKNRVHLPRSFIILGKCIITIENTMRLVNPEFSLAKFLKPYSKKLFWKRLEQKSIRKTLKNSYLKYADMLEDLPRTANLILNKLERKSESSGINKLESIEQEIHKSSSIISNGVVIAGLFITAALLVQFKIGPLYYGIPLISILVFFLGMFIALASFVKNKHVEVKA